MNSAPLKEVAPAKAASTSITSDKEIWQLNLDKVEAQTGRILSKEFGAFSTRGSSTQIFDSGNVLYSKLRPYLNKVVCPDSLGVATTELVPLRPDPARLDRMFLTYYLRSPSFVSWASNEVSGAKMPRVVMKSFWQQEIPLPPLAEQKRLAAILDDADALRAKRQKALAHLDDLLQSTFLTLFGDPVTNPMGWEKAILGEITTIDAPMVNPTDGGFQNLLHYGPDRISKNTGVLLPAKTAKEDEITSGKFLCSPGEVLYSKIRPNLNKVALVTERCLCSADVYPVRPTDKMTKEFLWSVLRSSAFLDYAATCSTRANIPKMNRKEFAAYDCPLPPLPLQQRFAAIVEKIEAQKARHRAHLAELDTLFASLQSRAFSGEL